MIEFILKDYYNQLKLLIVINLEFKRQYFMNMYLQFIFEIEISNSIHNRWKRTILPNILTALWVLVRVFHLYNDIKAIGILINRHCKNTDIV